MKNQLNQHLVADHVSKNYKVIAFPCAVQLKMDHQSESHTDNPSFR